jgi:transcription elongation factor Elf1
MNPTPYLMRQWRCPHCHHHFYALDTGAVLDCPYCELSFFCEPENEA